MAAQGADRLRATFSVGLRAPGDPGADAPGSDPGGAHAIVLPVRIRIEMTPELEAALASRGIGAV